MQQQPSTTASVTASRPLKNTPEAMQRSQSPKQHRSAMISLSDILIPPHRRSDPILLLVHSNLALPQLYESTSSGTDTMQLANTEMTTDAPKIDPFARGITQRADYRRGAAPQLAHSTQSMDHAAMPSTPRQPSDSLTLRRDSGASAQAADI